MNKPLNTWLLTLTGAPVAGIAIVSLASVSLAGQTPAGGKTTPPARAASTKTPAAPRTPWGDPDLQGNYTNVWEASTPLERPEQLAGRTLAEVKGDELADLKRAAQRRTLGNFEGPIHGPDHWWQDVFTLEKGSQAWLVTDPPDGRIPPMTPEAQKRIAAAQQARAANGHGEADSWEDRSNWDRCITRGMPGSMMPTLYGNSYRIVQAPGYVAITYEMVHETRVISMDGRSHVGRNIHLDMGDARGHWEGETLVVDTTNFHPRSVYRNASPDGLHLIERFTRVSPDQVKWSVTVDDASTWTRPWTFSMPLTRNEQEGLLQYECHEGNYGLRNILSAARAEERATEEAARKETAPRRD